MSKMAELALEIEELLNEGMTPKFISAAIDVPLEMIYDTIEQLECLEIERQYQMMSYADAAADADAQYYYEEV